MKNRSKIIAWFVGLFVLLQHAQAQTLLTPEAAIEAVLKNHPLAKAAEARTKAKEYEEKAAFGLPNPEINAESPTGEFYAIGLLQSFEFPTVYMHQKKVAKAETARAQTSALVNKNDLRRATRMLYLEAQWSDYQANLAYQRDSVFQKIAATAQRQFAAGDIDYLQKTLVENEVGKAKLEKMTTAQTAATALAQLGRFIGEKDAIRVQSLHADSVDSAIEPKVTTDIGSYAPTLALERRTVEVAEAKVKLSQSRALPNFSVGYLNQGARETPLDYRFRATVGIPLWVGQYRSATKAAQTEVEAARQQLTAQEQANQMAVNNTLNDLNNARIQVLYYEQEALLRSKNLILAAARMREAGQIDYPSFLRTLDQAFEVQKEYGAQMTAHEIARIELAYLLGYP
jgi:outer membrane protein, heavy metal efflux system